MFNFDPATSAIAMHRGDTGSYWVQLALTSGEEFQEGDIALYTVDSADKKRMIEREYSLTGEDGNGKFLIAFRNSDTDTWPSGTYATEIRVILNPQRVGGDPRDGDVVRTPLASISTLTILDVLREV